MARILLKWELVDCAQFLQIIQQDQVMSSSPRPEFLAFDQIDLDLKNCIA